MEQPIHSYNNTIAGTLGGTIFCFLVNLHMEDLIKTSILAAVGAVVSFCVSLAMKHLIKRFKR